MSTSSKARGHRHWLWIVALALVPLILAGAYGAAMTAQSQSQYNDTYFTSEYQERYPAPGSAAREWEEALQTGNPELVAELTGLKEPPRIEPNPDVILSILLEVDDAGYYHYLYFNLETYERLTYYIKEVKGRYVVVPEGLYFYWDSGQWLGVVSPVAIVWWLILLIAGVAISLFRVGAQTRETMFGR